MRAVTREKDQPPRSNGSVAEYCSELAFLAGEPLLEFAIVFGSIASGRARPDSDIDVAVQAKQPLDYRALQRISDQIAMATGRAVDLVDLATVDGSLLRQILRHGKIIFTKRPGIPGTLTERLLAWQEDFEPTLDAMLAARLKRFNAPCHGP